MYTHRPLSYDIHEFELVITDSLYIKGMLAFPVDVVNGVGRWLLYFDVGAVDCSQNTVACMSTMEAQKQILAL